MISIIYYIYYIISNFCCIYNIHTYVYIYIYSPILRYILYYLIIYMIVYWELFILHRCITKSDVILNLKYCYLFRNNHRMEDHVYNYAYDHSTGSIAQEPPPYEVPIPTSITTMASSSPSTSVSPSIGMLMYGISFLVAWLMSRLQSNSRTELTFIGRRIDMGFWKTCNL